MAKAADMQNADAQQNSARAIVRNLRTSPQKLNEVAGMIRGMTAAKALNTLSFSRRRIAGHVKKALQSAIANAENNHGLDVDRLMVREAHVGKGIVMHRFRPRARGRGASIQKPFSHLTIVVSEAIEGAEDAKPKKKRRDRNKDKAKQNAKQNAKQKPAGEVNEGAEAQQSAEAQQQAQPQEQQQEGQV